MRQVMIVARDCDALKIQLSVQFIIWARCGCITTASPQLLWIRWLLQQQWAPCGRTRCITTLFRHNEMLITWPLTTLSGRLYTIALNMCHILAKGNHVLAVVDITDTPGKAFVTPADPFPFHSDTPLLGRRRFDLEHTTHQTNGTQRMRLMTVWMKCEWWWWGAWAMKQSCSNKCAGIAYVSGCVCSLCAYG